MTTITAILLASIVYILLSLFAMGVMWRRIGTLLREKSSSQELYTTLQADLLAAGKESRTRQNGYEELAAKLSDREQELRELKASIPDIRAEAIKASKAVKRGQAYEQFAPYLIEGIHPADCKFMGDPIDMIVFDGLKAFTDGRSDKLNRVLVYEIKTGKARLSRVQRAIRDTIERGDVEFITVNLAPTKKEK